MRATSVAAAAIVLGALAEEFTASSVAATSQTVQQNTVASAPVTSTAVATADNHGNG